MSVLVTFAEVSAPDPGLGAAAADQRTDFPEGCTDLTQPILDGTSAPQGGRVVHSGTSMQLVTPAAGMQAGSSTIASAVTGDSERPPSASEHPPTSLIGLLREIGQGSHQAFEEFYRGTSGRVFGMVSRVVLDPGLSEEVTQEVFIAVWRDAASYDPALGSPITWLLTIAHRKAVDKVRSHQSSTNRDARWTSASWTRPYDEVATSALDRMDAQHLRDSLAALSELQREAILLSYFGSLTYREVAERFSKPLPTIKSRIRDGLKQLRGQIDPA
ncbi:ECF RNA polymerase sigma factor SigK [Pseudarthrobacter sp. C4D7]|uniref:ECF RNA polymerase sigma factor SigK n=1 Tax=Pseudarthrobacter sp. C4D7 TaxID=2735268 RepID=UPI001584D2E3|nr:ECF RNA polymerase sigma factor SigK [Pseudarthrobacter sp. C4D7]